MGIVILSDSDITLFHPHDGNLRNCKSHYGLNRFLVFNDFTTILKSINSEAFLSSVQLSLLVDLVREFQRLTPAPLLVFAYINK